MLERALGCTTSDAGDASEVDAKVFCVRDVELADVGSRHTRAEGEAGDSSVRMWRKQGDL